MKGSKFYEEKLHERELPNKMGQKLLNSEHPDQDRYGNPFVVHEERTYLGPNVVKMNKEDLTDNPKTIFDYTNHQVTEFFKRLGNLVPNSISPENLQIAIWREYGHPSMAFNDVYVYEDDGESKTEGFRYNVYWFIPLTENFNLDSLTNANAHEVIYFWMHFDERIHDGAISGRFFHLYFCGLEKHTKIAFNDENMTINSIITPQNLYKAAKNLIEYMQDKALLCKASAEFEA